MAMLDKAARQQVTHNGQHQHVGYRQPRLAWDDLRPSCKRADRARQTLAPVAANLRVVELHRR
eukprot:2162475-Pyramimonas_sp.AAC.1